MTDRLSSVALRILGTRETLGELAAINTTILKNGAIVYVVSVREHFVLLKDSTESADGSAVVQPVNGSGRWFRESVVWAAQADWYVDAINGDDSNSGLSATEAIATLAELERRIGRATLRPPGDIVTVHLLSDTDPGDAFNFTGTFGPDVFIYIIGEGAVELASGTLAAVTTIVVGTTRPSVTVTGFDWTPYVGKRCRVTATAGATPINTLFWVEAVDGGDSQIAYISQPYVADFADLLGPFGRQTLGAGDQFVVEELTGIGGLSSQSWPATNPEVQHFGMVISGVRWLRNFSQPHFAHARLYGCQCDAFVYTGSIQSYVCRLGGTFSTQTWQTYPEQAWQFAASIQANILIQSGYQFVLLDNSSMQGARIIVEDCFFRVSNQGGTGFSAWEWSGTCMTFQENGQGYMEGLFWGTSTVAGSRAMRVRSGSLVQYLTKPTASGADAVEVVIGGTTGTWAVDVPQFNAANGAAIVVNS